MIDPSYILVIRRIGPIPLRHKRVGFTLIEVLVVVAIIALLLSILLPSLKRARDQAKSAACAAQLSQLIKAEITYEQQHKGWIPGTPMSTGYWFVANPVATNGATWVAGGNGQPRLVNWFDWFTPLRIEMHGSKSLPADQIELMKQGMEGVFNCPSNPHLAAWEPYGGSGENEIPGGPMPAISYLPMKNIMLPTRSGVPGSFKSLPEYNKYRLTQDPDGEVVAPSTYLPRRNKLGRDSVKVFLADGTRIYQADTQAIKYITPMRGSRCGVYPRFSPAQIITNKIHDKWVGAWGAGRKISYRHGGNKRMNAAFFDGHVQSLRVEFNSQNDPSDPGFRGYRDFTGPAVDPHLYYPSDSIVKDPSRLHKNTIPKGTKLQ